VSIGLPVYNGGAFLRSALASLLAQTFADFELVISDNASTDETARICEEMTTGDPRVRYVRHATNQGALENFAYVLEAARAPYFLWAAYDDLWEPQFLDRLVTALDECPRAALAFCRYDNVDEAGRRFRGFREVDWKAVFGASKARQIAAMALLDPAATQKANHVYGLMRTEVVRACGGLVPEPVPRSGVDIHLLLRLLGRGEFVVVDELLFHYRLKTPPGRPRGGLLRYLMRRITGRTPGHGGNVLQALRAQHAYFSTTRDHVLGHAPIDPTSKAWIWLALVALEPWSTVKSLGGSAFRELIRGSDDGS
jgi:glycosyltransferase involved in cell wall biosynthesis